MSKHSPFPANDSCYGQQHSDISYYYQSDYMQFLAERTYILSNFQHYRIIQPQVIFLHGLPSALAHPELLQHQLAPLGRTLRINIQFISKDFYSAFVQFQNELSAALLIMIVNEQSLFNRVLRVFYGSTKFCPHYLKGHTCRMPSCNYAHYYIPHLTHLKDQAKQIDHYGIAQIHLAQNIQMAIYQVGRLLTGIDQLGDILAVGRERLQYFLGLQGLAVAPEREMEVGKPEEKKDGEWSALEKQICEQVSEAGDEEAESESAQEADRKRRVQQFLDAAQRFLTRLIFQSSQFVY